MNLLQEIFTWLRTCPLWIQDAARRLYGQPDGLSEADYKEIYQLCLKENGISIESAISPQLLDTGSILANVSDHTVIIKSLRSLKHVNAVESTQKMEFIDKGLTIIYGQNGSGKSGYARVFKKACFSRDKAERIIPNVTKTEEQQQIPEAIFDIVLDGQSKSILWRQSSADTIKELAYVSVFDTKSARVVLSKEQECYYIPYGLDILQNIGNKVIPQIKALASESLSSIDLSTKLFAGLTGNHEVGRTFENLASASIDDIELLAQCGPDIIERGKELTKIVQSTDLRRDMENARLSAVRIANFVDKIVDISKKLSDDVVNECMAIKKGYDCAIVDERKAAKILQDDDDLLPGTGDDLWKSLFEAARKFSIQRVYPEEEFPAVKTGNKCVLCQQTLTEEASTRLIKFNTFVSNELSKKVRIARIELDNRVKAIFQLDIEGLVASAVIDEINNLETGVASSIRESLNVLKARKDDLLASLRGEHDWFVGPLDKQFPMECVRNLIAKQYHVTRRLRDSMDESKLTRLQTELDGLRARVRLSRLLPSVKDWFMRKARHDTIQNIIASLSPLPYTRKAMEFSDKVMTEPMKNALTNEFNALGVSRNAIVLPKYKARGSQGRVLSSFGLNCQSREEAIKVLSEGQLKAIALASFFAETDIAGHTHAMVFDDPITSLDIHRMKLVANRLAQESQKRQVIVFSHNAVFVNCLRTRATKIGANILEQSLSVSNIGAGIVNSGVPWSQKNWTDRISEIRHLAKELKGRWTACPDDKLVADMRVIYDKLRATIERIVQDVCLNGTVRRFEDYIRVKNLEKVPGLDLQLVRKLINLYDDISDFVEAHDHSEGAPAVPDISQLQSDITSVEDTTKAIIQKRNTAHS